MQFSMGVLLIVVTTMITAITCKTTGTNCSGDDQACFTPFDCGKGGCFQAMLNGIDSIENSTHFNDGEVIHCLGVSDGDNSQLCTLFKNTGSIGGTAAAAKILLADLIQFGCETSVCGAVPVNAGNNVATGELVVDFVDNIDVDNPLPPDGAVPDAV